MMLVIMTVMTINVEGIYDGNDDDDNRDVYIVLDNMKYDSEDINDDREDDSRSGSFKIVNIP